MSNIWEDDGFKLKHMEHLIREVEVLRTKIQPHGTGNIHTAISVMELRIDEMRKSIGQNL